MNSMIRLASSVTAAAVMLAPVQSLAFGLGLGLHNDTSVSASSGEHAAEVKSNADVRADAKADIKAYRAEVMAKLKSWVKDKRDEGKDNIARLRVALHPMKAQLNAALAAEAKLAVEACTDKTGDAKDQCYADAKVKLQAKVNAAIEAMKK